MTSSDLAVITFPQHLQWCRRLVNVNFEEHWAHVEASLSGTQTGASRPSSMIDRRGIAVLGGATTGTVSVGLDDEACSAVTWPGSLGSLVDCTDDGVGCEEEAEVQAMVAAVELVVVTVAAKGGGGGGGLENSDWLVEA